MLIIVASVAMPVQQLHIFAVEAHVFNALKTLIALLVKSALPAIPVLHHALM